LNKKKIVFLILTVYNKNWMVIDVKKFLFVVLGIFCFFLSSLDVSAEEVHIYLFYGNTCPVCERERTYLEQLKKEYPDIQIFEFETYENPTNLAHSQAVKDMYSVRGQGVPFTVVGDTAILGFSDAIRSKIESSVKKYQKKDYYDRVGVYLGLFEDEEVIPSSESVLEISESSLNDTSLKTEKTGVSWPFIAGIVFITLLCIGGICYLLYVNNSKKN